MRPKVFTFTKKYYYLCTKKEHNQPLLPGGGNGPAHFAGFTITPLCPPFYNILKRNGTAR